MLPRKKTVPLRSEFARIREDGKLYDSALFGLVVAFGEKQESATAAFVISKKVSKSSVVRHDIKRKLSHAVEVFLPRLSKNVELVFLAKTGSVEASREEIKKELEVTLKRAKLI